MSIFHKLARGLAAAAALAFAGACATTPPLPAAPAVPGPALWKVADKDTTIYLFGTVHALPKDVPWMRGAIGPALAASDTLVTEVDLAEKDPAAMQQSLLRTAFLPQDENLRGLLTDEQRAKYEAALDGCAYALILADYILPDLDGLQALELAVCVGCQRNGGADLRELSGLLVKIRRETAGTKRMSQNEPADACADDRNGWLLHCCGDDRTSRGGHTARSVCVLSVPSPWP